MAQELKITNSTIFMNAPKSLLDEKYIVTIGDICTIKVIEQIKKPNLCIVDFKTKRNIKISNLQMKIINDLNFREMNVSNPAGTITDELWNAIDKAIKTKKYTKIIVDGEEDLATLAVISLSKIGTKVIYGMPDKGMVVVDVNQHAKKRANDFLKRMLVN